MDCSGGEGEEKGLNKERLVRTKEGPSRNKGRS